MASRVDHNRRFFCCRLVCHVFVRPHFDVICDLLLNTRTATWNLFVKRCTNSQEKFWIRPRRANKLNQPIKLLYCRSVFFPLFDRAVFGMHPHGFWSLKQKWYLSYFLSTFLFPVDSTSWQSVTVVIVEFTASFLYEIGNGISLLGIFVPV